MSEERRQVLEMLASGKVTVEQADELLDVLGAKQPSMSEERHTGEPGRQAQHEKLENVPNTVTALIRALEDEDGYVRTEAARALGLLGQPTDAVLSALSKALHDEEAYVRCEAARGLGLMGRPDDAVLSALNEALGDEDGYVRTEAARALGIIGGRAHVAGGDDTRG
jgi:HEAT repeats